MFTVEHTRCIIEYFQVISHQINGKTLYYRTFQTSTTCFDPTISFKVVSNIQLLTFAL
jgi:hypothetical protein